VGDVAVSEFAIYEFGDWVDGFSYEGFCGVDVGENGTKGT
jgi:hypothetical protein